MADVAVLNGARTGRKPMGIVSFKGIFESIDKALDNRDTKKAEKKYEEIRDELIASGTQYTEEQYKNFQEIAKQVSDLKPYEVRKYLDTIREAEHSEENKKNGGAAVAAAVYTCAESVATAVTGESLLAALLGSVGIVAPPATTIVACALAAGTLCFALWKMAKSKKVNDAKTIIKNKEFMEKFLPLVEDVKKLCAELDKTKAQDIESLKTRKDDNNPNTKRVTAEEFKKNLAKRIVEIIDRLKLVNLNKDAVMEAYGLSDVVKEVESELENGEQKDTDETEKKEPENKETEKKEPQKPEEQQPNPEKDPLKILEEIQGERGEQ